MSNNRNSGPKGPTGNPSPAEIRAARESVWLSQTAAADLIHCTLRGWQEWEAGNRRMHPAFWELWRIKAGLPNSTS